MALTESIKHKKTSICLQVKTVDYTKFLIPITSQNL